MLDQLTAKELNESSVALARLTEVHIGGHEESSRQTAAFTRNLLKMDTSLRSSVMEEIHSFKDVM